MTTKWYSVVTFGDPGLRVKVFTSLDRAKATAYRAKGRGTCTTTRVYECDTRALARTADISEVRAGERIAAQN